MSQQEDRSEQSTTTKKFGKGERQIPTQKARKYYPAEDESKPKKVCYAPWNWEYVSHHPVPGYLERGLHSLGVMSLDGSLRTSTNASNQVRKSIHPAKPRPSLQPGSVLILLAGRFRGKRVILLKHLPQGVLLVTGPFKINGVPLRRVNARYVIATSLKVELKGIDEKTVEKVGEEGYFTREKKQDKKGEEAFFKQGEKPEVGFRTRTG